MKKERLTKNGVRLYKGEMECKDREGYRFKYKDTDGKYHVIYEKTLSELRKQERKVMKLVNSATKVSSRCTINDRYEVWKSCKAGIKDHTFKSYIWFYEQYVMNTFGNTPIATVVKSDVRTFYRKLSCSNSLSASTIKNVHLILHQVFERAVEDKIIEYNPTDGASSDFNNQLNRNSKQKRCALTINEQKSIVDYLRMSDSKMLNPIIVLMGTGMRIGELCGLQWEDINFDSNEINIRHNLIYYDHRQKEENDLFKCRYEMETPKSKNGTRIIPMLPAVKNALLAQSAKTRGLRQNEVCGYSNFVFLTNQLTPILKVIGKNVRNLNKDLNYYLMDNGLDPVRPFTCHVFRHTFTTILNEYNVNQKVKTYVLGHEDANITDKYYTHLSMEFVHEEMNKFSKEFTVLD